MMALVNISSLLEYGRPTAVLQRIAGIETRTSGGPGMSPTLPTGAAAGRIKVLMVKRLDGDMSKMDIDNDAAAAGEPPLSPAPQEPELSALSLVMAHFCDVLAHPPLPFPPAKRVRHTDPQSLQHDHPHLPRHCPPRAIGVRGA